MSRRILIEPIISHRGEKESIIDRIFSVELTDDRIGYLIAMLNQLFLDERNYFNPIKRNNIMNAIGIEEYTTSYKGYYELKHFNILIHSQNIKDKTNKIQVSRGTHPIGLEHTIKYALTL